MPRIIKILLALEGDSGGTRLTSHINLSNDRDLYELRQCRIIKKYAGSVSLPGSTSVKPRLSADLYYRPSVHRLSTYILRTSTRLYGKFTKMMRSSVYARRLDQRF